MPDDGIAFGSITGTNQDLSNTLDVDIQPCRSPTEPGEIHETAPPQDGEIKSVDEGTNHSSPLMDKQNNKLWKLVSTLLPNAKEEVEQEILHTPPQQPPTKATDAQRNVAEHATNVQVPITLEQGKVAEKTTNVQAPAEQGAMNPKLSQWGNDIVRLTTMYVYPNGQTYNKMVNDPHFVQIPGCTQDTGQPLSFQDRAVSQTLRGWHDKADGAVEWHNQNIEFAKDGLSWSAYE
ncbi:hypothetical protein GYMLUDRAFT_253191 [Collybiopsis luxurians FD-317 M1]|uniref:Uncharacterized protein n=1 Tax=Collybiopsis luxurians FD-317 M1 TaxID=944289 RepID=A0A0D0AJ39_9AGAR|nr:hypothetical protein GYMLUDRAFT_253191 [Collybiopsis luxurians FD-317 M1]